MSGLVLNKIYKSFNSIKVLDNISLELKNGELMVLLGPSGCGKSTLLRIIAGLEKSDSGEIFINEKRIDMLPPKDRNTAMVFQNYSLYPHMTIEKNLAFPLKISGMPKDEIRQRVSQTAQMLGLSDRLKDKPGQLSGGQRQRVALGRAIIRKPDIFLLDEPLSNLDADLRTRMRQEIVNLQKKTGVTTIHVTHDQAEALTMADRIALLKDGQIIQIGTPEQLYASPQSLFVAEFIGYPKINVINASVENGRIFPFGLPVDRYPMIKDRINFIIAVRPESIKLVPGGKYKGVVLQCEYHGDQYITTIAINNLKLIASGGKEAIRENAEVNIDICHKEMYFFDSNNQNRLHE